MSGGAEPTLEGTLSGAAEGLGVVVSRSGAVTTWAVADRPFATVSGGVAEFRLDGPVAAAARRTPDATSSDLGPDWVRFTPRALDGPAIDRAVAWFAAARRRAG